MKLNVDFTGILISAGAKDYKMQNGQSGTSYSLGLEHCGEVGNVKCSKQLYDLFQTGQVPKYQDCAFHGVYDTDYRNMTVDEMHVLSKTK